MSIENQPEQGSREQQSEEIRVIDGHKYKKSSSGYTVRQYYSHNTSEKGPGSGWDTREKILAQYGVQEPRELPDEPHYFWVPIEDES